MHCLQDSSAANTLHSEWFSHSYLKASHRDSLSNDEEEEVESRFRGTPLAVTTSTAKPSIGLPVSTSQPPGFADLKTPKSDEATVTPAGPQRLTCPSETPGSNHKMPCALAYHRKDMPHNWMDSLRHRKRPCPFANDKSKQVASSPSTPKNLSQAASAKRQLQVQTTLPERYCRAAPRKTCQNAMVHSDARSNANPSDQRAEHLPQKMEDCKLNIPQTSPTACNQKSSNQSQQDALAILMTGKPGT